LKLQYLYWKAVFVKRSSFTDNCKEEFISEKFNLLPKERKRKRFHTQKNIFKSAFKQGFKEVVFIDVFSKEIFTNRNRKPRPKVK